MGIEPTHKGFADNCGNAKLLIRLVPTAAGLVQKDLIWRELFPHRSQVRALYRPHLSNARALMSQRPGAEHDRLENGIR